jgi:hypothetical protein
LLFSFLILAGACGQATEDLAGFETPPAQPERGMATLAGRVLAKNGGGAIANEIIRLAEVYRESEGSEEGAYVLDLAFSPGTRSDEMGYFVFDNIPANEYVIVVGDVNGDYAIIREEDGRARVWNAEVDNVLNVGVVKVDLEPR